MQKLQPRHKSHSNVHVLTKYACFSTYIHKYIVLRTYSTYIHTGLQIIIMRSSQAFYLKSEAHQTINLK